MSAADSNPSDRISDEKLPLEFTAYFHLPHRRGRGATDFNFGRWVQHHSCDSGFPADRAERYDLWQRILTRFADEHGGENTQEVDDTVRKRAREAITKTKKVKRKVGGGAAGMAVNKVVLKGVRAGRDINVNVGVAAATGIELAEREKLMPEVDIPPPPYVDGGGSESGRVGEKSGDRVQRKSNRYLTRKRPRSRSPSDSPAPPSPESNANKQSQPQLQIPTTTSISVSRSSKQKQKQIRLRINPNTNPNATTNVTAPGQRITIPNTITPTSLNPNSNHDSLFSFRESLFTIHTQLTLLRGEVDLLRDAVAGLFQHEALAVLDTLRNPTPASVRIGGGKSLQTGGTNIKADEIDAGSETEKDPSLVGESINSETAGGK